MVTLTASVGAVTRNPEGTWSWSFATTDGPAILNKVAVGRKLRGVWTRVKSE